MGSAKVVPLQVTGPAANRFNLVIIGDGYTEAEAQVPAQVDKHLNIIWSIEPYKSYRNYINVYMVEIISGESGIDCDPDLTSPRRDTPLHGLLGRLQPGSVQRLLTVNNTHADAYAASRRASASSSRSATATPTAAPAAPTPRRPAATPCPR